MKDNNTTPAMKEVENTYKTAYEILNEAIAFGQLDIKDNDYENIISAMEDYLRQYDKIAKPKRPNKNAEEIFNTIPYLDRNGDFFNIQKSKVIDAMEQFAAQWREENPVKAVVKEVKTFEQILKEHGIYEYDTRLNAAIADFHAQFATEAGGEKQSELIEYILHIHSLTTTEFCKEFNANVPQWTGSKEVAVMDFLSLDAIKWRLCKDKAKELYKAPVTTRPNNSVDVEEVKNKIIAKAKRDYETGKIGFVQALEQVFDCKINI